MITSHPPKRRIARVIARARTVVAASMLAVVGLAVSSASLPAAHAVGTDAGPAEVISMLGDNPTPGPLISSGGSATRFGLRLPTGAECPGDSSANWRVQSYMVPTSVDPATLTFDADGPTPQDIGPDFRQPLYDYLASPYVNGQPGNASQAGGPGPVVSLPPFSFAVLAPGNLPAGSYNVGIACTLGAASDTQLDRFWNVEMTFVDDAADLPAGVTWTVAQTGTTTTTPPGATTTAPPGATTTTPPGATTTTPPGATTTTPPGATTSTTRAGSSTTSGGSSTTVAGGGSLARTGGSAFSLVAGSLLLVILGRMVVLVVRTPGMRTGARK